MAVPVLQPQGFVAAGAVYFIDGGGVVRRLDPSGGARRIATFPVTSVQQAVSFAVSPDGRHVMAALFTYPSVVPGPSGGPPFMSDGRSKLDLELASEGGTAKVLAHWEGRTNEGNPGGPTFHNITMAGWDSSGPIGLIDGYEAVQNQPIEGQTWFGGHLARLAMDGTLGSSLTAGCDPYSVDQSGTILCTITTGSPGSSEVRVLTASGQLFWKAVPSLGSDARFGGFALSPDRKHLAMDGGVASKDSTNYALPSNLVTRGWLDNQTIIGLTGDSNASRIAVVRLSAPSRVDDWGFTGEFIGLL